MKTSLVRDFQIPSKSHPKPIDSISPALFIQRLVTSLVGRGRWKLTFWKVAPLGFGYGIFHGFDGKFLTLQCGKPYRVHHWEPLTETPTPHNHALSVPPIPALPSIPPQRGPHKTDGKREGGNLKSIAGIKQPHVPRDYVHATIPRHVHKPPAF